LSEIGRPSLQLKTSAILKLCVGLAAILGAACAVALMIAGIALAIDSALRHWAKAPTLFPTHSGFGVGLALSFLLYTSVIVAVIGAARVQGGAGDWRDIVAWHPWRMDRRVWLIVGATIAYGFCADFALSRFSPGSSAHFTMPTNVSAAVALSILAVVFAPFAEELVFRGWIFTRMRQNFSFPVTLLLTSVVFAALHYDNTHLYALAVFPIGLALGAIREATGGIKPAIAFHALNNLIACGLSLLD
jgi:uncharacterized protein